MISASTQICGGKFLACDPWFATLAGVGQPGKEDLRRFWAFINLFHRSGRKARVTCMQPSIFLIFYLQALFFLPANNLFHTLWNDLSTIALIELPASD
jgi:hypothetical protein